MIKFKLRITGLNPNDEDLLVSKLEIVKDKLCPKLDIDCTMLKRYPNTITIKHKFNDDDLDLVFELYNILTKIEFNKTKWDRFDETPHFECGIKYVDENYGVVV